MEHPVENAKTSQEESSSVRYSLSAEGDTSDNNGRFYGNDLLLKTEDKPKNRYCTNCGNLLPSDCKFCPNCGHKVEASATPLSQSPYTIKQETTPSYVYTYSPTPTQKKQNSTQANKILIIIGIIFALVIAIIFIDAFVSDNDSDLTPMTEPISGEILTGVEAYDGSTITITASGGESCVVKLKTSSGVTRLSFYVRAGTTVTVGVPSEYLYVYFASGDTWYGNELLFGEHTSYSMDDEILDFTEYSWEYTLYPVSSGNFSETPIDADEFK